MLPESFKKKIYQMLGKESDEFFDSYKEEHFAGLRVNTLRLSPEEFKKISPVDLKRYHGQKKDFIMIKQINQQSIRIIMPDYIIYKSHQLWLQQRIYL